MTLQPKYDAVIQVASSDRYKLTVHINKFANLDDDALKKLIELAMRHGFDLRLSTKERDGTEVGKLYLSFDPTYEVNEVIEEVASLLHQGGLNKISIELFAGQRLYRGKEKR